MLIFEWLHRNSGIFFSAASNEGPRTEEKNRHMYLPFPGLWFVLRFDDGKCCNEASDELYKSKLI